MKTLEDARSVIERWPLDFGCRPGILQDPEHGYRVPALAREPEIEELRNAGYGCDVVRTVEPPDPELVDKEDRFHGGRLAPRGLGMPTDEAIVERRRL